MNGEGGDGAAAALARPMERLARRAQRTGCATWPRRHANETGAWFQTRPETVARTRITRLKLRACAVVRVPAVRVLAVRVPAVRTLAACNVGSRSVRECRDWSLEPGAWRRETGTDRHACAAVVGCPRRALFPRRPL